MQSNNSSQEIDLSYLTKKIVSSLDAIGYSIFKFFKFLLKNIIVIGIVVIIGAIVGFFLDKNVDNSYKQEVIVVPNFNSISYLYSQVENVDLNNSPITSIEIEPVVDVYQFIRNEWNNLEVAKYLSQNNVQFDKYKPGSETEKFYRYHLITITTNKKDENGKIVDSLLAEFNKDPYFSKRQNLEIENRKELIKGLEGSVESVDQILEKIANTTTPMSGNLNIEMYSELNNLISSKRSAILEINRERINQLEETEIIFPTSKTPNIKVNKMSNMILIPALLFGLFLIFSVIRLLFKKYNRAELMDK